MLASLLPRQSRMFFLVALLLALAVGFLLLWPFLVAIVFGVFAAVLTLPLQKRMRRKLGPRRSAAVSILVILFAVTVPLLLFGYLLFEELQQLLLALRAGRGYEWADQVLAQVAPAMSAEDRFALVQETWGSIRPAVIAYLEDLARRSVGILTRTLIGITVALFVIYYTLVDGDRMRDFLCRVTPLPDHQVNYLLQEGGRDLDAIFRGQLLTALIQGALGGLGFFIAGVPSPVLWTLVMVFLSVLPLVGPFLVWVPAAVYLLATGHIWQGVFLTVWGAVVVSQVDNFLRPHLIGGRSGLHPLAILLGVLGGVAAFGFIGLFLGPLIMGIIESLLRVWEQEYLDEDAASA